MREIRSLRWYFVIYDFVAEVRVARNDLDPRIIHSQLTMVLSTGILMWSYAFLAMRSFSTPIPAIVGFTASLIHLFSPLLFLITPNAFIVCLISLGAGLAHQSTFAFFSGGFQSCIMMWLPILPLLAGFIGGKKCLIGWMLIVTTTISVFLGLHLSDYSFPMLISKDGYQIAMLLLLFGWLFILFCTTWVHVAMRDFSEEALRKQTKKIDDLFRVLFHDLANSLGRMNIGISLCERDAGAPQIKRGLQVVKDAQVTMTEITQNVRRMYAVSKGKADVELALCPLNDSVEHVQQMFAAELEKKKIRLNFDQAKNRGAAVMVDPVSFNNQVLANIISNAIKFSPPGNEISISVTPAEQNMICLEVKDSGIGMPPPLLNSLFDMNKRTSRPGTNGESGTGFGMHIMKSFVEMYQGEIQIESVEEGTEIPSGTSVRLILKGQCS